MADLTPLPPAEAIRFLEAKGYRVGFAWQDTWHEQHAQDFTVAKMAEVDLLQDTHASLTKALKDGQSYETWAADIEGVLKARGWWGRSAMTDPLDGVTKIVQLGSERRLRIIFDTNVRMSMAAGQWERIRRLAPARPYLRYVAVLDAKVRPEHLAWHGTILPWDHPWWKTHSPPCGWRCRCHLQQVSAKDVERNNWQVTETPPPEDPRPWLNKRTGEVSMVPAGVDPGFAYHKGDASGSARRDMAIERLEGTEPAIAREAVKSMVAAPEFADFATGRWPGSAPVAILDRALGQRVGATAQVVRFSQETAVKQAAKHAEVEAADYALVQEALDHGTVVQDGDTSLVFVHQGDTWWHAAVKATRSGRALFLTSFRRTTAADMQRAMKRGTVVRDGGDA